MSSAFFLELYDLIKKHDATILVSARPDKYLCVSIKEGDVFRNYRFNGDIDKYSLTYSDFEVINEQ